MLRSWNIAENLVGIIILGFIIFLFLCIIQDNLKREVEYLNSTDYWETRGFGKEYLSSPTAIGEEKSPKIHTNLPVSLVHEHHRSLTHFGREDRASLPKMSSHWSISASECEDNHAVLIGHNLHRRDLREMFWVLNSCVDPGHRVIYIT